MFEQTAINKLLIGNPTSLLLCADATAELPQLAPYLGQAQLVYMDPPFFTGGNMERRRPFGTTGWRKGAPAPVFEAYSDRFESAAAYMDLLRGLAAQAKALLKDSGLCALHLDWHGAHYGRLVMDEVFGEKNFLNEIIWAYESGGRSKRHFPRKHDNILLYSATPEYRFDLEKVPLPATGRRKSHLRRGVDETGRSYGAIISGGKEYRYYDDEPSYPGDVWTDISHLQQRDPERTGYANQKPLKLLERLLRPTVAPGDLVAELCCGSGTALAQAQLMHCPFVGVDNSPAAISVAQHRLKQTDFAVEAPCDEDAATLHGQVKEGVVTLSGLEAAHPAFPKRIGPMDALEAWYAGHLQVDGSLAVEQSFRRSFSHPEIPQMGLLNPSELPVAVLTVDAAGRRRGYVWQEEQDG